MKKNLNIVKSFVGNQIVRENGTISFVNDFTFPNIKRFYQISNEKKGDIQAFHGHMLEKKFVFVTSGSYLLCIVPLDNPQTPSKSCVVKRIVLEASKPKVVLIPKGCANGFKNLQRNSKIIFFSTSTLLDSENDDYRYPYDYWGSSVWNEKHKNKK